MKQRNLSTSNFKEFFIYFFCPFIIILFFVGVIINYYFEKKIVLGSEISGAYKVNRIITKNDTNEIAFLGSSRAQGSFIPDSLVGNGFNYGLDGTGDDVMLFFLNEECKKTSGSSPIIINFDLDGLNYSIGDLSNYIYNAEYYPIKKLLGSRYNNIYNVPFIKYYGCFDVYTKYYLNSKINLTKYTNKGASLEKNILSEKKFSELVNQRLNETTTFHNDSKLLLELLNIIKSNDARMFIFVVAPYHNSFFEKFTNLKEADEFLADLRKKKNVVVLNFGKTFYPDNCFMNTTHLNLKGAIEFNKVLKDSLSNYVK